MEENNVKYIKEVQNITNILLEQKWENLNDVEALKIAVQIQKNRILSDAYGVSNMEKYPAFLEAIAMANGYTSENPNDTNNTANAIEYLADKLEKTNNLIEKFIDLKFDN